MSSQLTEEEEKAKNLSKLKNKQEMLIAELEGEGATIRPLGPPSDRPVLERAVRSSIMNIPSDNLDFCSTPELLSRCTSEGASAMS